MLVCFVLTTGSIKTEVLIILIWAQTNPNLSSVQGPFIYHGETPPHAAIVLSSSGSFWLLPLHLVSPCP